MAKANALNKQIEEALNNAEQLALDNGTMYVDTALAYDGIQKLFFLAAQTNTPDHNEDREAVLKLAKEVKNINSKYGINSKKLRSAWKEVRLTKIVDDNGNEKYPDPLPKSVEGELADDMKNVLEQLQIKANEEKQIQGISDLLGQLFANKTYVLFQVFVKMADMMKKAYDDAVANGVDESELPPTSFDVNIYYSDMQKLLAKSTIKEIKTLETEEMSKYLTNINKYVDSRSDLKFVGMAREIEGLEVALAGRTKKSAVLVGPAGTGKTSLVYELARRINSDDEIPELLRGTVIYEMHMDALVAGSQYRGQFEARLKNILDAVSKLHNVLLFIDEFHTICKAGGSGSDSGGDMTGSNILKPYISRGDIWIVGATTSDEFHKFVEKDKAITRRFEKVLINEPSKEETIEIMKGVLPINESFFDKTMQDDLMEKIYTLSTQYNMNSCNPDKALTMLESAFAYSKVCRVENKEVTIDDMIHAIELKYNINISETKAADTRKFAKEFLLGQDEAIDKVCKYLDMVELNVVDPLKTKAAFMLVGPTGVGKTELCKIIAKHFTGSEENLVKLNMGEYSSEMDVSKLTGSSAGYVGYDDEVPLLKEVRQKPNAIVLFDEIEKANKSVLKILLNILDEGEMTDNQGNKVSFRGTIVIMTTNLGFGKTNHKGTGMMSTVRSSDTAMTEINKYFSPEFMGRLDEVIAFDRLSSDIAEKLIKRYAEKYAKQSGIEISFSKKEIAKIAEEADIETLGARNLDHAVKVAFAKKAIEKRSK